MQGVAMTTDLDQQDRAALGALLREGYGIEDVAHMTGWDEDEVRACIRYWREGNYIWRVLRTDRARNAEALKIMGLSSRGDTQPCD